jgi:hypothetical protein
MYFLIYLKQKEYPMKRIYGVFFGFAVMLIMAIFTMTGCDTGTSVNTNTNGNSAEENDNNNSGNKLGSSGSMVEKR